MKSSENLYFKRQQTKTSDGEFIHKLLNSYELSIKLSELSLLVFPIAMMLIKYRRFRKDCVVVF